MGTTIKFNRPDGQALSGYLAEPAQPNGAPAVVVVQEWWGLNDQIRGVADRLAHAGFLVLVPDLYRGLSTVEKEEAHHLMTGLDFGAAAAQDVRGAVQYLKTRAATPSSRGTAARRWNTSMPQRSTSRCKAIGPTKISSSRRRWSRA